MGAILNIIVGIIGGALGSWIFGSQNGILSQILVGTAGSIAILWICSLISKK